MDRPHILYLHSHDTGRYVQPYGHAVPTPNVQRLAEEGVLFRQAFAVAPTCSPSRAGLLTGMAPHAAGMTGLAHRGFSLTDPSRHLVPFLHGLGYTSALAGIDHVGLGRAPTECQFQTRLGDGHRAEDIAQAACAFLAAPPKHPFFLSVGFFDTHREARDFPSRHEDVPPADPRYAPVPPPLPDLPETRADMAGFMGSARNLDAGIGAVLDQLDASGLAERTLVICTTDHGIAFPGLKCNLTAHGLGVMLILRGPGGFAGGRVCDALVSQVDLFPTLCDLLGLPAPDWLQGTSLMPLIRGEREEVRDEVYGEVTYHAAYEPMRSVRTKRWSYIRRFGDRRRPVLANVDDGPSKDVMLELGWGERGLDEEELYDLALDPIESRNRAADPGLASVLADLRGRLDRWMEATEDPLLRGPVPAPSGAQVNGPDDPSPYGPLQVVP